MKSIILIIWLAVSSASTLPVKWNPEVSKAQVKFNIAGPFGQVNGKLSGLTATILFDEKDLVHSSMSASVEAKTIQTGVALRNRDLREKKEWLDASKYQFISFYSKKIEKKGDGYTVTGDLTIKAITKSVQIPFTFNPVRNTGILEGKFMINREDYKLGKTLLVGKEITITLEVPVVKESSSGKGHAL